ncbi:hypothetical protein CEXT_190991 [Caerostris extrusa]|uniref:Uncharacterized protein n=1 Tax=Caerostris extrusa TaxID=172846 RepID=A0AAV4QJV2_CAEEX|nr:hypothetical protein CEXT_190991 [Caerostris extrusa]
MAFRIHKRCPRRGPPEFETESSHYKAIRFRNWMGRDATVGDVDFKLWMLCSSNPFSSRRGNEPFFSTSLGLLNPGKGQPCCIQWVGKQEVVGCTTPTEPARHAKELRPKSTGPAASVMQPSACPPRTGWGYRSKKVTVLKANCTCNCQPLLKVNNVVAKSLEDEEMR